MNACRVGSIGYVNGRDTGIQQLCHSVEPSLRSMHSGPACLHATAGTTCAGRTARSPFCSGSACSARGHAWQVGCGKGVCALQAPVCPVGRLLLLVPAVGACRFWCLPQSQSLTSHSRLPSPALPFPPCRPRACRRLLCAGCGAQHGGEQGGGASHQVHPRHLAHVSLAWCVCCLVGHPFCRLPSSGFAQSMWGICSFPQCAACVAHAVCAALLHPCF